MSRMTPFALLVVVISSLGEMPRASASTDPAVTVRFPAAASAVPLDGRIILLMSRDFKREPRSHVSPNLPLDSPYLFGLNVDGLKPGTPARIVGNRWCSAWPFGTIERRRGASRGTLTFSLYDIAIDRRIV